MIVDCGWCAYCGEDNVPMHAMDICVGCADDGDVLARYHEDCDVEAAERAHDEAHRHEHRSFYEAT
jgi:hypothetical protein